MSTGLVMKNLDVEAFIRLNNLKPVTNPISLIRKMPTADGVLSYEIFGTSQEDRKNRMAYIDLYDHYMLPVAAKKLSAYDRRLSEILYSTKRYRLVEGDLVADDENGQTGPEFLYKIWGKVNVRDKETMITKEVETFFRVPREKLFITKYPVIPAFYRDINEKASGTLDTEKLNAMYSSLISYAENLNQYSDTFTMMKTMTQARLQKTLVNIYEHLMIKKVKGSPSKYGMLRRYLMSKSIDWSSRLVISAPLLSTESVNDMQVRYGYALIPLAHVCTCFFPFMVHHMKKLFDAEFVQGGKHPVFIKDTGKIEMRTFVESFDENYITKMITKFLNSPGSRFDPVETPKDETGKSGYMVLAGRFLKENTTFSRRATVTDILYIVAKRATEDKHVYVTRYPLDNYNGQFPAKIEISTTMKTTPAIIGETAYQFFPICEGDANNAFLETLQFSNTYLKYMGGDYLNPSHGRCGSNAVRNNSVNA